MNAAMFSVVAVGGQASGKVQRGDVGELGQVGVDGRGDVNGHGSTVAVLRAARGSTVPGADPSQG